MNVLDSRTCFHPDPEIFLSTAKDSCGPTALEVEVGESGMEILDLVSQQSFLVALMEVFVLFFVLNLYKL